jgi:hypothetical protein
MCQCHTFRVSWDQINQMDRWIRGKWSKGDGPVRSASCIIHDRIIREEDSVALFPTTIRAVHDPAPGAIFRDVLGRLPLVLPLVLHHLSSYEE